MTVILQATECAICGPEAVATEIYPANFNETDLNPSVFSQRRVPDKIHYRIVRCRRCGLVRSDPAADASTLESLYEASESFDAEEANLRRTYGRYLARLERHGQRGGNLLEIGSGTGFFLALAQESGYVVTGLEPSRVAATKASKVVDGRVVNDVLRPALFDAETFDVVCLFQVLDHLPDPNALLAECNRIMRPGGLILALNHDVEALTNRLLRDSSPIIDIEHTYLYSRETMRVIFANNGFLVREQGRVWNDYSLNYLARLIPFPSAIKATVLGAISRTVGGVRLRAPLGNLYLIARKPGSPTSEVSA